MSNFVLGHPDTDHVTVEVIARGYPQATDYWDGNWLRTTVSVAAGA